MPSLSDWSGEDIARARFAVTILTELDQRYPHQLDWQFIAKLSSLDVDITRVQELRQEQQEDDS